MPYKKLTTRKNDTLTYLKKFIGKNGFAPTLSEIAQEFGISRERAKHIVNALVTDKKIRKTTETCRNLELL